MNLIKSSMKHRYHARVLVILTLNILNSLMNLKEIVQLFVLSDLVNHFFVQAYFEISTNFTKFIIS